LARVAYLPRLDAVAQVNRATGNSVFGMLLPQPAIPSISGPVLGTNNFGSAWGSAVGGLVSWEPFDFGFRQANVNVAEAARTQSEAALKRTEFKVTTVTLDSYVTVAAAQQAAKAAQAGVDRAATILRTTNALVVAQLRPGADSSRAEAELAAARTQLVQAEQAVKVARASLAQFVGADPEQIAISAPALLQLPADQTPVAAGFDANPFTAEQDATVEQARAQLRALERSYFPRFAL
jgi:outer membrane protein